MSYVLTDEELAQVLRNRWFVTEGDARAIERAVVAKLHAQGIDTSPERVEETAKRVHDEVELPPLPEGILNHLIPGHDTAVYTYVQLEAYARAAVLADRQQRDDDLTIAYLGGVQAEKERQRRGGDHFRDATKMVGAEDLHVTPSCPAQSSTTHGGMPWTYATCS